ncbi:MAG: hypothetical protein NE334_20120 [Lentisphaeraceae bacterium]|nr:hypothetical protein [Lentisphaeraceae bacterium]
MAFRISEITTNGERLQSVLIEKDSAVISSDKNADLKVDFPNPKSSIKVTTGAYSCKLEPSKIEISTKGEVFKEGIKDVGQGADFTCGDHSFYVTMIQDRSKTEFKKGHLATLAVTLSWIVLAIQLIVPLWLPYKIVTHEAKGRNVLVETCSERIDNLRNTMRKSGSDISGKSIIHNDIVVQLKDEVEQLTWTFRNAGEFMNIQQLEQLVVDIEKYEAILLKLEETEIIDVEPVKAETVIQGLKL